MNDNIGKDNLPKDFSASKITQSNKIAQAITNPDTHRKIPFSNTVQVNFINGDRKLDSDVSLNKMESVDDIGNQNNAFSRVVKETGNGSSHPSPGLHQFNDWHAAMKTISNNDRGMVTESRQDRTNEKNEPLLRSGPLSGRELTD